MDFVTELDRHCELNLQVTTIRTMENFCKYVKMSAMKKQ
jgi:hypothetical protein